MKRRLLWLVVSGSMTLSLVITACGQAAPPQAPSTPAPAPASAPTPSPSNPAPTTTVGNPTPELPQQAPVQPSSTAPKYGGTINRYYSGAALTMDDSNVSPNPIVAHANQKLMEGDWTKGAAGGFGTNETHWGSDYPDLINLKTGTLAEGVKWSVDTATNTGTIVYTIRQGIHWAQPNTDAGRTMAGREFTADDALFNLNRNIMTPGTTIYRSNTELHSANLTKTGPWEITIQVGIDGLMSGLSRFSDSNVMYPPDVIKKYGNMSDWRNSVGTGPYMLSDYVPGSSITLVKNPNYWMKNPIGPGKGDKLPYLDQVKYLGIPDASTRMAAVRTGKLDESSTIGQSDALQLRKVTGLMEIHALSQEGRGYSAQIVHDKAPFNDIRVRQALMLATDFKTIVKDVFQGEALFQNYPVGYVPEYKDMFLSVDDPDYPPEVKSLFTYNPDKAKQLLKDAGYPNGFNTSIVINGDTNGAVDYYSVIKDMWSKVGINLSFDLKTNATFSTFLINKQQTALVSRNTAPIGQWLSAIQLQGEGEANAAIIHDATVDTWLTKIRTTAVTDTPAAMKQYREMTKYIVQQVWAVPEVTGYRYTFWWPWLKNYSGEYSVGYADYAWDQFVWLDKDLKASMGR